MKEWIVREGKTRNAGRYLWSLAYIPSPSYASIGIGSYRREESKLVPEWDASQLGAERFDRIDKAARAAKRCDGRVVALKKSGK